MRCPQVAAMPQSVTVLARPGESEGLARSSCQTILPTMPFDLEDLAKNEQPPRSRACILTGSVLLIVGWRDSSQVQKSQFEVSQGPVSGSEGG